MMRRGRETVCEGTQQRRFHVRCVPFLRYTRYTTCRLNDTFGSVLTEQRYPFGLNLKGRFAQRAVTHLPSVSHKSKVQLSTEPETVAVDPTMFGTVYKCLPVGCRAYHSLAYGRAVEHVGESRPLPAFITLNVFVQHCMPPTDAHNIHEKSQRCVDQSRNIPRGGRCCNKRSQSRCTRYSVSPSSIGRHPRSGSCTDKSPLVEGYGPSY